eukprot:1143216-Pelagomonas_calceolata.AAC.1
MFATMRKSACCAITPPIGRQERKIFTKETIIPSTAGIPLIICNSWPMPHTRSGAANPQTAKREAAPNKFQSLVWRMDALASMARQTIHS